MAGRLLLQFPGAVYQVTFRGNGGASIFGYTYDRPGFIWAVTDVLGVHTNVYAGWNLISETINNSSFSNHNFFFWGLDLSGTLQGAGGVGGLLAVIKDSATYVPVYDANGNIMEYVSTDGTIVAHREYDPFGGTIVATGDADAFTHWFSTKPWCAVTELSEYQYRTYSPLMGRWLSRDPIGEEGDANFYCYCCNSPILVIDILGLITSVEALQHYKSGPDDPSNPSHRMSLRMSFDEIDTSSVRVQQFPKMIEQLKDCKAGIYQISWQSRADNLAFTTSGDQALFLGDISLKLEGTLTVKAGGDWSFLGTLKCFDDFYDFNASTHRGPFGELLTRIGREDVAGKPYWIEIRGSKQASDSGNCCNTKDSSPSGRGWY